MSIKKLKGTDTPTNQILDHAQTVIEDLKGHHFDILSIGKPKDLEYAQQLARIISKISPLVGNLIELEVVRVLNMHRWETGGKWVRQDPGFPDTIFQSSITPTPGFEIKTWFPFATEITARFKDSVTFFKDNQTRVAVLAWIPEFIIYGRPKIIGVWTGSGKELATSRDTHYHNPPDYLVMEPEDTTDRTSNLQQTNVNGMIFQGSVAQRTKAKNEVKSWGTDKSIYSPDRDYQARLRKLQSRYPYRLDTNFAKIDRIGNASLEKFKDSIMERTLDGIKIHRWAEILASDKDQMFRLLK